MIIADCLPGTGSGALCAAHPGGGPLLDAKGADDRLRHPLSGSADLEILQRPLRLGAPVPATIQHRNQSAAVPGESINLVSELDWHPRQHK